MKSYLVSLLAVLAICGLGNSCQGRQSTPPSTREPVFDESLFDEPEDLDIGESVIGDSDESGTRFRRRPPLEWQAEWLTDRDFGLVRTATSATLPILLPDTVPPPLVKVGFAYTDLFGAESLAVSDQLFEYSIGLTWIKPVNSRWTVLTMLGATMATDNENRSSDAWQFRGGVLGICNQNEQWQWTIGAIAMGRDDLPVLPAVGAVWTPTPDWRFDITFPRSAIQYRIRSDEIREHWLFTGLAFYGRSWAVQRGISMDDRLTYRDWRLLAGWETRPASTGRMPAVFGTTIRVEAGVAFAREYRFFEDDQVTSVGSSILTGISTRF